MSDRILYKTITSPDDFKNPLYCYIVIRQLEYAFGESFEDCGGSWAPAKEVLEWLLQKNHITEKQYMRVKPSIKKQWHSLDFLFGYGHFSLMENGECEFPAYNKGYQLLCEYISEHEEEREKLYNTIYDWDYYREKEDNDFRGITYGGYWHKKSYEFLIQDIYQDDIDTETVTKQEWLRVGGANSSSYADEFNFLKNMSIAEADYYAKYKGDRVQISVVEKRLNFYRENYELDIKYVICNSATYQKIKENSIHFFPNTEEDKLKILQDSQKNEKYRFAICDDLKDDEIELR